MNEPVKSGDKYQVVSGALGSTGPNIGKTVTVVSLQGEHTHFGRIWRCSGADIVSEYGAVGGQADFAQSWLKKIPPIDLTLTEDASETTDTSV